ncbi:MAG: thiolase family protein [Albidovulum sp.]|nr:thiolase family protein [Albidovulum sp.]
MTDSSYIVAARRTPVAPRNGALHGAEIHVLAAPAINAALADAKIAPADVDELILGNAIGGGGNPARMAGLLAGLPKSVGGISLDRQCCSGLDAVLVADALIKSGAAEIVLAGGAESYSRRPIRSKTFLDGKTPLPYDRPPFSPWPSEDPDLADAADQLACRLNLSRRQQDEWTVNSHRKALASIQRMRKEIVQVPGASIEFDSYSRNLSMATCARAGIICGTVTTANTAPSADGAAVCLVVSKRIAANCAKAVRIVSSSILGGEPKEPGIAPVESIRRSLKKAGCDIEELHAAEIMEAYASQAIACVLKSGLDARIVNRRGGALARGHPIGASGAILAVRLFHELDEPNMMGLAAIAAAGGLGTAMIAKAVKCDSPN